jgi:hypothetical protein
MGWMIAVSFQAGTRDFFFSKVIHITSRAHTNSSSVGKGKGKVFPLQARLWPRVWVEV